MEGEILFMDYNFFVGKSKIYDFIKFPKLIYTRKNLEKYKDNYAEIIDNSYVNMAKKAEGLLSLYKEEVEMYYMEDLSFIELASRWGYIFKAKDIKEYLNIIVELDENKIITNMICSIISKLEKDKNYEEVEEKAKNIIKNEAKVLKFIKDLPIDSGEKWNLFVLMEEPEKYMKQYVGLMKKLLPIFEELYMEYNEKIRISGDNIVRTLEKEDPEYIEVLSNSKIDIDMIEGNKINILISAFDPYTLKLIDQSKIPFIVWGLEMEMAFKKIKEIDEEEIEERVQIFKNLGDRTRYEVLKLIAENETSTKVIANTLEVSSATISYHINNLAKSKIIKVNSPNERYKYTIDYKLLDEVIEDLKKDFNFINESN